MNCKITLALAVLAVVMVSIQAASLTKRQAVEERPETPLLQVCEEPGENRENCFLTDPASYENWRIYIQEIEDWEKKYPEAAAAFNAKTPGVKKEELEKLEELKKFAEIHDQR